MQTNAADLIYLDNNATTRPDAKVVDAMLPLLREKFYNPSSPYPAASGVADAIAAARTSVMRLLGARRPSEIVFTSGGSESIHTAFHAASQHIATRPRVVTSAVEHSAVKAAAQRWVDMDRVDWRVIDVDQNGRLDRASLFAAIDQECGLVSLMLANNETGVISDLEGVGQACRAHGALLHLDAVQGPGKMVLDMQGLGADFASLAAHKFHGPKGVGALYVRHGVKLPAWLPGGPQENERRAGTENTAGIVGMGVAADIAAARAADPSALARLADLRDRLETGILQAVAGAEVHGHRAPRLPNTSSIYLPGGEASLLLALLADAGVFASAGSACNAGSRAPSPVLLAMGLDSQAAGSSLRFSLSHETSAVDIQRAVAAVAEACRLLLSLD